MNLRLCKQKAPESRHPPKTRDYLLLVRRLTMRRGPVLLTVLLSALALALAATNAPADRGDPYAGLQLTGALQPAQHGLEGGLLGLLETPTSPAASSCVQRSKCCMVCSKGKACGDSCISRNKTCHKGRGCACNSSDVCG